MYFTAVSKNSSLGLPPVPYKTGTNRIEPNQSKSKVKGPKPPKCHHPIAIVFFSTASPLLSPLFSGSSVFQFGASHFNAKNVLYHHPTVLIWGGGGGERENLQSPPPFFSLIITIIMVIIQITKPLKQARIWICFLSYSLHSSSSSSSVYLIWRKEKQLATEILYLFSFLFSFSSVFLGFWGGGGGGGLYIFIYLPR